MGVRACPLFDDAGLLKTLTTQLCQWQNPETAFAFPCFPVATMLSFALSSMPSHTPVALEPPTFASFTIGTDIHLTGGCIRSVLTGGTDSKVIRGFCMTRPARGWCYQ